MNSVYREQVRLLLHILPLIYREKDFAVHGGTAINLFVKNMPRYSVDVDLTYIPVEERGASLQNINGKLLRIGEGIKKAVTTVSQNRYDEVIVSIRTSDPTLKVQEIYDRLHFKSCPCSKRKFVVHKSEFEKMDVADFRKFVT